MTTIDPPRDLVVLCADRDIEYSVQGILSRPQRLSIRPITCDTLGHPEHDPGCRRHSHEFLRSMVKRYRHALVIFDRDGCGAEAKQRDLLEQEVEARLSQSGWDDRARAVAIEPEIESWVWSDSPHVEAALGWTGRSPDLKSWLHAKGYLVPGRGKPQPPKQAMVEAMALSRKPASSAIFKQIAMQVSLERCTDAAFVKLRHVLQAWFPR